MLYIFHFVYIFELDEKKNKIQMFQILYLLIHLLYILQITQVLVFQLMMNLSFYKVSTFIVCGQIKSVRKACESSIFLFHRHFFLRHLAKRKVWIDSVATSRYRQTPVLKQQRSPHPKVQAFAFHCCWVLFEVGDFRGTPSRSKHFLYPNVIVLRLCHINHL